MLLFLMNDFLNTMLGRIQSCAAGLGMQLSAAVYADASATPGIVQRRGIGKVRHICTHCLWLQVAHATKRLVFEKIDGGRNPSDRLTKQFSELLMDRHMKFIGAEAESGRAETAPEQSLLDFPKSYVFGCRVIEQDALRMSDDRHNTVTNDTARNDHDNQTRRLQRRRMDMSCRSHVATIK